MSSAKAQDKWTHFSGIAFGGGGRQGLQTGTQALTLSGDTDLALQNTSGDTTIERNILVVDPGGASRNLDLPPEADSDGMFLIIVNSADAAETLTIRNDANDKTVATIGQNEEAIAVCNGTAWYGAAFPSGTESGYLDGITPGTVTASKALVVDASKGIGDLGTTSWVVAGGTALLSTNTAGDTTTARHKFQSKSDGGATEVGDLLGLYGVATVTATDTVADAKTITGLLTWTEVLSSGDISGGGGGTVIAGARHIFQTVQDLTGVGGRASALVYAEAWNDATGGDIHAGLYILNNQQTAAKTIESAIHVQSGDGFAGGADFLYGLNFAQAKLTTAIAIFPDDGAIASDAAEISATSAGWLKIVVGSETRYINLYSGTPS